MSASSRPRMATVLPSPKDQEIFRDLAERFAVLAQTCFQFSRDIYLRTGGPVELHDEETIRRNISIAQHDFGNRLVEILAVIYFKKSVGFQELLKALGGMSTRKLSGKLQGLEAVGLVEHAGPFGHPTEARYSLTHKGVVITRLGEPVLLYLRLAEGWTAPIQEPDAAEAGSIHESKTGEATGA